MPDFGPNAVKDMRAYVSHGMHHRCPHTTAYVSPSTTCVLILHVHRRCPSTSAHVLIPLTTCVLILLNAPQLSAYSHGMHHICVRILLCVCHTPLHMCHHTNKCTCPHTTKCTYPHIPMCPDSTKSLHTTQCAWHHSILLCLLVPQHNIYVLILFSPQLSSYCYVCVLIPLHVSSYHSTHKCPLTTHPTTCVSSYHYYTCVRVLLCARVLILLCVPILHYIRHWHNALYGFFRRSPLCYLLYGIFACFTRTNTTTYDSGTMLFMGSSVEVHIINDIFGYQLEQVYICVSSYCYICFNVSACYYPANKFAPDYVAVAYLQMPATGCSGATGSSGEA
jgi:hypothetical protein